MPPRSPDLNSMGHLQSLVHATPVDNEVTSPSQCGRLSDYPQLPRRL
jgi:hypothetical protein